MAGGAGREKERLLNDEGYTDPESGEEIAELQPLRPAPIRYMHACLNTSFLLFGKEYGWAGFAFLILATASSVSTSVYTTWLYGCMVMMIFFATIFCFSGYQAVSGRYELARPLLLAGFCMFLSCILGGHFFREWAKHAGSETFKDIALASLPGQASGYEKNAVFFFRDGKVVAEQTGSFRVCKDKLPVVGTCVYDYYCVAPIRSGADGGSVHAWAGIMSHVACDDSTFLSSPERMEWGDDSRSGLGIVRSQKWDSAIADSLQHSNATEAVGAPLVSWTADPMKTERVSWHTAWTVECATFAGYLIMVAAYSYAMGYSSEAYPSTRKILDPNCKELPSRRKVFTEGK